ncbi:hypothetical protein BFP97_16515 [Roseivirga sp. 4D4]|nr:hypothetical protein BFP97_16515 [Roseivirga sp. 4D4]
MCQKRQRSFKNWTYLLITLLLAFGELKAQTTFSLTPDQSFKVAGTSTLHDWEMVSDEALGNAKIVLTDGQITSIQLLTVDLPANSLKSGKKAMDKNAYKALDTKEYPNIHFELTEFETLTDQRIKAKGRLTIAGTIQEVLLDVSYEISENAILFEAEFPITFTQFKIEPPKALLGTIKTGDELQISFRTTFKSVN